ncbi:hypothetical protein GOODEAATRI_007819, partial [Goodea atripinnis]
RDGKTLTTAFARCLIQLFLECCIPCSFVCFPLNDTGDKMGKQTADGYFGGSWAGERHCVPREGIPQGFHWSRDIHHIVCKKHYLIARFEFEQRLSLFFSLHLLES